jgi:hypothetical protein
MGFANKQRAHQTKYIMRKRCYQTAKLETILALNGAHIYLSTTKFMRRVSI